MTGEAAEPVMEKLTRREAVIFDMDGVILDTERLAEVCWREDGQDLGLEGIIDVLDACTGVTEATTRRLFAAAYADAITFDAFEEVVHEKMAAHCPDGRMPVKPGASAILRSLRRWGVRTALASSTKRDIVAGELSAVALYDLFDEVVCGDMVARSKPAPDIFLTAAKLLKVRPEDCWVIEDSHNGVRAAHAAGMHPIMVPDRMPVTEEMRALTEGILPDLDACGQMLAGRFGGTR